MKRAEDPRLLDETRVVMTGGPLAGLKGTVVEFKPGARVVLSVALWRRTFRVEIDQDWVALRSPAFSRHLHLRPAVHHGVSA